MLINGGLGELRQFAHQEFGYDDDREYGTEKRFTCIIKGGEVAFSGWGKTVILPIDEALAITGLLSGRAKGAHEFIGSYKGSKKCDGPTLAELCGVQTKESKPKDWERIADRLKKNQMKIEFAARITGESVETLERWLNE